MKSLTVSVPDELKKRMDKHPEINWPIYLRKRLELKVKQLRKFEQSENEIIGG